MQKPAGCQGPPSLGVSTSEAVTSTKTRRSAGRARPGRGALGAPGRTGQGPPPRGGARHQGWASPPPSGPRRGGPHASPRGLAPLLSTAQKHPSPATLRPDHARGPPWAAARRPSAGTLRGRGAGARCGGSAPGLHVPACPAPRSRRRGWRLRGAAGPLRRATPPGEGGRSARALKPPGSRRGGGWSNGARRRAAGADSAGSAGGGRGGAGRQAGTMPGGVRR